MNPRKLTPSMSLLLAFEAAARHCSFTRAADELALTQSAVSRQVQALESLLEVPLFKREGRRIELTAAGALYQHELAAALSRIRSATLQTIAFNSQSGTLHLAVLPTFGSKWLLPRLKDFYAGHPGIQVHIHSRIVHSDLSSAASEMDAIIFAGAGNWPGYITHELVSEELIVIASPEAVSAQASIKPIEIAKHALLNVVTRPHAWSQWFEKKELDHRAMRLGPSFELTSHLIQAVVAGIGVGLVPRILVQDEIDNGDLIELFDPVSSDRSYYLAYQHRYQNLPSLVAFREWLLGLPLPGR